jgi:3-hydroxymyristoyl/3-hydroxydecanoyl-(acyl carrier protein) dehydratase
VTDVTRDELEGVLAAYGAGLEAELSLLHTLESLATREQHATQSDDLDLVATISDERTRLMSGLLIVEHEIRPLRPILAGHRQEAEALPGLAGVAALHQVAGRLVGTILSADEATLHLLHDASAARKAALQALENGGQTLSAYRRVIAPPMSGAALVDRRG